VKLGVVLTHRDTVSALRELQTGLKSKAAEFAEVLKMGRTENQGAVSMTLGQEFGAYAVMIDDGVRRSDKKGIKSDSYGTKKEIVWGSLLVRKNYIPLAANWRKLPAEQREKSWNENLRVPNRPKEPRIDAQILEESTKRRPSPGTGQRGTAEGQYGRDRHQQSFRLWRALHATSRGS
jgi:hypothetical protein